MKPRLSLGVYSGAVNWVVEIGPGSGRYVEKTLSVCSPSRYEVYETATKWGSSFAALRCAELFQRKRLLLSGEFYSSYVSWNM
jgi:hypothetical protein